MSNRTVYVVVEGVTELTFVRDILAPTICNTGVFLHPIQIGRLGHRGGNVRFVRASDDISRYLKQQSDARVTTMFDFFRIGTDWPGLDSVRPEMTASQKADHLENATLERMSTLFPDLYVKGRFIPYISMHEFEALLYSDIPLLATGLGVREHDIACILEECNEPEEIDEGPESAPSKRLIKLKPNYLKVSMGKSIAEIIGIDRMREACPHFHKWITSLENLAL